MKKESVTTNHYWKDVFQDSLPQYGLLGHQISYSLSPHIHQFVMDSLGIHGIYKLLDVPPHEFDEFMEDRRTLGMKGLNITKPYKWLTAKKLGSEVPVNTIFGNQQTTNTDCIGFIKVLDNYSISTQELKQLIVFGGGGFAYSIMKFMRDHHPHLDITCITRKKIQDLEGVSNLIMDQGRELSDLDKEKPSVILHATSSNEPFTPLEQYFSSLSTFKNAVFIDSNYGSKRTKIFELLTQQMQCIDGLTLLIEQARESQRLWWKKTLETQTIIQHLKDINQ